MWSDEHLIAEIDSAFGDAAKPAHFTNYTHCGECAEHDELLLARDRQSLQVEDVANPGWSPLLLCTPEGVAYYLPSLVRLTLSAPVYGYDWLGDRLVFLLAVHGEENSFLKFCDPGRRHAIVEMLEHLRSTGAHREDRLCDLDDFAEAKDLWSQT